MTPLCSPPSRLRLQRAWRRFAPLERLPKRSACGSPGAHPERRDGTLLRVTVQVGPRSAPGDVEEQIGDLFQRARG